MSTFAELVEEYGAWHWWRMHSATPATESDVGAQTTGARPFLSSSGTITAQQPGPLGGGQTTYSVQFASGAYLARAAWDSAEFGDGASEDEDGSIMFWFRTAGTGAFQWIVGLHPTNQQFAVFINTSGKIDFRVVNGANNRDQAADTADLTDDEWHFVVITSDNSATNCIYVDGVLQPFTTPPSGTGSLAASAWQGDTSYGSAVFRVGQSVRHPAIPGNNYPFVGYLSELAFFPVALTAEQVYFLWSAGRGVSLLPSGTTKTYLDLDLPMTNSAYMAQRLAYRRLLQGNLQRVLAVPASLRAMEHAVGDVLTVTIDDLTIDAETWRAAGWRRGDDGTIIELALREDAEAAYIDPIAAEYTTVAALPTLTPGTPQVPPPTALSATAALEGIQLSWTGPDNLLGVHHYNIYSNTSSAWSGATLIGTTLSTAFLHALSATVTRYYWVRAVDASGYESTRSPDSDTSTVSATYTAGTIATPGAAQTLGGIDGTPATGQLTGSFTRAGVTVASKVFTATHSGGNLTVTAGSDSGEATTYTLSGDGTPTVVVTQKHTGSNTTNGTMTFTVAP
jgi:hypothetical protein